VKFVNVKFQFEQHAKLCSSSGNAHCFPRFFPFSYIAAVKKPWFPGPQGVDDQNVRP